MAVESSDTTSVDLRSNESVSAESTPIQSSSPDASVPVRRMDFEAAMASLPKHFARDGDLISSHIIAALSSVFPDGEDFFVRSVRAYRDQITDPVLKRQVAGFIGQESIHGREHRTFNKRLAKLGYPTRISEKLTKLGLETREKIAPPMSNLAVTAALEHFTATLAELVLSEPEIRDIIGNEAVQDLFVWHALEESEHKAVAFDVYRATGGGERLRIVTMKLIRTGFLFTMILQIIASLAGDRATYKKGRLRSSFKVVKNSPLARREVWDTLRAYDRRGFHPNDIDNTELMVEWREKLFGEDGTLTHYLRGASQNSDKTEAPASAAVGTTVTGDVHG